jgi:hypothetical protein
MNTQSFILPIWQKPAVSFHVFSEGGLVDFSRLFSEDGQFYSVYSDSLIWQKRQKK